MASVNSDCYQIFKEHCKAQNILKEFLFTLILHAMHIVASDLNIIQSHKEKKGRVLTRHMTKAPIPTEMSKGQSDNTNNATKKFDYTAIADRLRTVSWNNYSHPTVGVNWFTDHTSPLSGTAG